jgi:carbon storage regulator CsrA
MLVLSREIGSSVRIQLERETCLITVLKLLPERDSAAIMINRASAAIPGQLENRNVELAVGGVLQISDGIDVTLIQLLKAKARLGVNAPKEALVYRPEIYEAMRKGGCNPEDGTAGSPVPRPSLPKPPSLDVRLDQPPPLT